MWVGVAHALDSDKIESFPANGKIFARKSLETPLTTPRSLSIYDRLSQNALNQVKEKVDNKLARDKEIVRQKRAKARRAHLRRLAAIAKQKRLQRASNASISYHRVSTFYHASVVGNLYTPGNCTWGVKNWRPNIPNNWGNASSWLYNAQAQGWATGSIPRLGAVGWSANHVVLVVGVSPLMIKEMNWAGLYSVRTRAAATGEFRFIY